MTVGIVEVRLMVKLSNDQSRKAVLYNILRSPSIFTNLGLASCLQKKSVVFTQRQRDNQPY